MAFTSHPHSRTTCAWERRQVLGDGSVQHRLLWVLPTIDDRRGVWCWSEHRGSLWRGSCQAHTMAEGLGRRRSDQPSAMPSRDRVSAWDTE